MRFLRKLFAPKEQVWKPYCDDIGGHYLEGGFWKRDRIEIPHQGWTLTLLVDTGDAESHFISTRLSAKIEPAGTGKLLLWLVRDWPGQKLLHLVRLLGVREAAVRGLAVQCLVLAFDVEQAQTVFGNPELQTLINEQPKLFLLIGLIPRSSRSGLNEVVVSVPGIVEDIDRLKSLVALCRQVIDALSESGIILPARAS